MATLWPATCVKIEGETKVHEQKPGTISLRTFCPKCGGPVVNDHSQSHLKAYDFPAGVLDIKEDDGSLKTNWFKPAMHVYYKESIWNIKDGLPKFLGLPQAFLPEGQTEEKVPEDQWQACSAVQNIYQSTNTDCLKAGSSRREAYQAALDQCGMDDEVYFLCIIDREYASMYYGEQLANEIRQQEIEEFARDEWCWKYRNYELYE